MTENIVVEELRRMAGYATVPETKSVFLAAANMVEQNLPVLESQLRRKIAEELRNFPDYPGVMKIAAGLVDGSYVRPEWDEVEGELVETEHTGNPYSEVLERIADSLDQIAETLENRNREPKKPKLRVVRKNRVVNRDLEPEDEVLEEDGPKQIPPRNRCGFLVEHYIHPLDKKTSIYQVSQGGYTVLLDEESFKRIDDMADEGFAEEMGREFVGKAQPSEVSQQPPVVAQDEDEGMVFEFLTEESQDAEGNRVVRPVLPDGLPPVFVGERPESEDEEEEDGYWDAIASQARGEALGE